MRLWTLRKGPPFKCHLGDNCSGGLFGKEIDNDGNNRIVCFRSVDRIDACARAPLLPTMDVRQGLSRQKSTALVEITHSSKPTECAAVGEVENVFLLPKVLPSIGRKRN